MSPPDWSRHVNKLGPHCTGLCYFGLFGSFTSSSVIGRRHFVFLPCLVKNATLGLLTKRPIWSH